MIFRPRHVDGGLISSGGPAEFPTTCTPTPGFRLIVLVASSQWSDVLHILQSQIDLIKRPNGGIDTILSTSSLDRVIVSRVRHTRLHWSYRVQVSNLFYSTSLERMNP